MCEESSDARMHIDVKIAHTQFTIDTSVHTLHLSFKTPFGKDDIFLDELRVR
jgi:hypothetical protein